ncbi:MAG TPA: DUF3307 domain-containing protein [Clostridiales bacterium]|nr:DUF3307 domain-containing protein [Clostridiales bacterium]
MFKEYFIVFLLGHILGDFYLQSDKMARNKEQSIRWVFIHGMVYLTSMIFVILPFISYELVKGVILASILHFLIDIIKYIYFSKIITRANKSIELERDIFFLDQALHFICLVIVAYLLAYSNELVIRFNWIEMFFYISNIQVMKLLSWILALLIAHKPANIVIQNLLKKYKVEEEKTDKNNDKNAGRFIGTVERIIMLIFLSIKEFSAIGLVLTAKSIARYDKISKDKDFAEYYLLGTLISTTLAIVTSLLTLT